MRHLPKREVRENVEILRPASFRRREDTCTVPEMALYVLTNVWTAVREAGRWRPDIVHAHFAVPTGPVALIASLFTGIPYVLTVHLGDVPGGVPEQTDHLFRLVGPLVSPVWHRAKAVTAVSRFVARLASKAYGIDPIVVPNGVRLVAASPVPEHSRTRILMAGRLSIQKNPLLAIRALALIREMEWSLDVIGDGPLRAEMEALGRHEGIADRVTVHGWLSEAQVAERMAASDILLLTSLQEGSANGGDRGAPMGSGNREQPNRRHAGHRRRGQERISLRADRSGVRGEASGVAGDPEVAEGNALGVARKGSPIRS